MDRLSSEQQADISASLKKFRSSLRRRVHENILYEELVEAGMTDEEASEYVGLEVEDPE